MAGATTEGLQELSPPCRSNQSPNSSLETPFIADGVDSLSPRSTFSDIPTAVTSLDDTPRKGSDILTSGGEKTGAKGSFFSVLTSLTGFVRQPWKGFGSSKGRSSVSGSGGSTTGPHQPSRPHRYDSAASSTDSPGEGRGSLTNSAEKIIKTASTSSDVPTELLHAETTTDMTKLPVTWNMVRFSELELIKVIGEGSFGQVWVAKYCQTAVAVKVLAQAQKFSNASASIQAKATMKQLCKEAAIMSRLRHPNVTQYLGVCTEPPCLLMEYCSRRSVDVLLSMAQTDPKMARQLSWARLLSIACDAAKGMLYLHSRQSPIIHRDLKSANLLVDAHWHVKVADFNLSRVVEASNLTSTICITNPRWLPPEVLLGGQAEVASDVWAFGTVMWELMTWELPFEKMNPFQIIMTVTGGNEGSGLQVPPPDELPAGPFAGYTQYVELMQSCWSRNPADRPKMDTIVSGLLPLLSAEWHLGSRSISSAGSYPLPLSPLASQGWSGGDSRLGAGTGGGRGGGNRSSPFGAVPTREVSEPPIVRPGPASLEAGDGGSPAAGNPSSLPSLEGPLASGAGGETGSAGGDRDSAVGEGAPVVEAVPSTPSPPHISATQRLLAEGHVTVGNAGASQMDSGSSGYPFVNRGFFQMVRSELRE